MPPRQRAEPHATPASPPLVSWFIFIFIAILWKELCNSHAPPDSLLFFPRTIIRNQGAAKEQGLARNTDADSTVSPRFSHRFSDYKRKLRFSIIKKKPSWSGFKNKYILLTQISGVKVWFREDFKTIHSHLLKNLLFCYVTPCITYFYLIEY